MEPKNLYHALWLYVADARQGKDAKGGLLAKASKLHCKGVKLERDRFLVKKDEVAGMTLGERAIEFESGDEEKSRRIIKHLDEFFQRAAEGERMHVLSSQLVRKMGDKTGGGAHFSLHQRFLIKEIGRELPEAEGELHEFSLEDLYEAEEQE